MRVVEVLARIVLRLATDRPARGREEWALAMRAEFDALDRGRLGWAIGCWAAMTGWRLKTDGRFLLLLPAVSALLSFLVEPATVLFLPVPPANLYAIVLLLPALAAAALGAARPDLARTVGVGFALLHLLAGQVSFLLWFGEFNAGPGSTLFDAPPVVGAMALLGACYIGAVEGARLRGRRAR